MAVSRIDLKVLPRVKAGRAMLVRGRVFDELMIPVSNATVTIYFNDYKLIDVVTDRDGGFIHLIPLSLKQRGGHKIVASCDETYSQENIVEVV